MSLPAHSRPSILRHKVRAASISSVVMFLISSRSMTVVQRIRGLRNELRTFNPAVYKAVERTTDYAALFRSVKRTDPAAWSAFRQQMFEISISPSVSTATVMPKP